MARVRASTSDDSRVRTRPAISPDIKENELVSLAIDLVEQRLRDGTASAQETCHFLKIATSKARIEKEILEQQKELISAKTEALKSAKRVEALYADAIKAFRNYNGQGDENEYDDY